MRRLAIACFVFAAACGASVPKEQHERELAEQQAAYEQRLLHADAERKQIEDDCQRGGEDREAEQRAIRTRIDRLELALADKERQLADPDARAAAKASRGERRVKLKQTLESLELSNKSVAMQGDAIELAAPLDLFFPAGSVHLSIEGEERVKTLAEALVKVGFSKLEIAVHADGVPVPEGAPVEDAWALTQRQGWAVLQAFLRAGADPSRLVISAFGRSSPKAGNDGEAGRAENRRILFLVRA